MLSCLFLNDKANNLLTLRNAGSIKYFKLLVLVCLVVSDVYLSYFLNPAFNYSNNLLSFSVER